MIYCIRNIHYITNFGNTLTYIILYILTSTEFLSCISKFCEYFILLHILVTMVMNNHITHILLRDKPQVYYIHVI